MTHRSLSYFLPSYATLLREFRNGPELVWAHYHRRPAERAVFWNGQQLRNVAGRTGFVDTVVEMWGLQEYTCNGFYTPVNGDVVLDLGANVGLFSIWMARQAPKARVLAFEPFSENCAAMQTNLAGWQHDIRLRHNAVGGNVGTGRMLDAGARSLDHRLVSSTQGAEALGERVEVITLESAIDLADAPMIDLLKIDIEGAEVEVFEAADVSLLRRIRRVALEFHDNIRPGTRRRIEELLAPTHRIVAVRGESYGILQAQLMHEPI